MTLNKYVIFTLCIFATLHTVIYAQQKDTIVIVPLGNSQLYSEASQKNIRQISAGTNFLNLIDQDKHYSTYLDDQAFYIESAVIQEKVNAIKSGDIHSVALYADSTIVQFFVQSGITMFYPEKLRKVTSIACGPKMSVAITSKNIMYTWGPKNMVKKLEIPLKIYGVKTAAVGENFIAFINIKNKVFVWGNRSADKSKIPVFKSIPIAIACGDQHVVALDKEGNVYTWGNNLLGQCDVPVWTGKVKSIDAKKNRSLVVLENNEVRIWGMNEQISLDYSKLGTVKQAVLGNNFAALLVASTQPQIDSFQLSQPKIYVQRQALISETDRKDSALVLAKDSLLRSLTISVNEDFVKNYLSNYYMDEPAQDYGNNNSINVVNENSLFQHDNSSTRIQFEGSNNDITIINRGVRSRRKNVNQLVIVKGSGKKYTIVNQDTNEDISDADVLKVINLDEEGIESTYPEEYLESNKDQLSDGLNASFIEFDNLPNTMISEMPVTEGQYWHDGEFASYSNDYTNLLDNARFWEPFDYAQACFYCHQPDKAIAILKGSDVFCSQCKLALFEIYYYGLFGISPDQLKAKAYYQEYLKALEPLELIRIKD